MELLAISVLRLILFLVSFSGISIFLWKKYSVKQELTPIISLSLIVCTTLLFGYINFLMPAMILIFTVGIVSWVYIIFDAVKEKKISNITSFFSVGIIIWIVGSIYLFIWLNPAHIYYYDNFTHWELIVKNIFYDSAFPVASDRIIEYQTYPLGTAAFITYVLKIVGFSEGHMLFAHSFISLSAGVSLFSIIDIKNNKGYKLASCIFTFLLVICLVTCYPGLENGVNSLMVDRLLAAVAISAYVIIIVDKNSDKKLLPFIVPVLTFLSCIKASGFFFVVAIACAASFFAYKRTNKKKNALSALLLTISGPVIYRIIWTIRCNLVFADSSNSTHAVSLSWYKSILGEKTISDIKLICSMFANEVFKNNYMFLYVGILSILLILLAKKYWNKFAKENSAVFTLVYAFITYVTYQIGNLCMYIFSMPWIEARRLCWYARYVMTVEVFIFGVIAVFIIILFNHMANTSKSMRFTDLAVYLIGFALLPIQILGIGTLFVRQDLTSEEMLTDRIREIAIENNLDQNQDIKYFVCFSDNEDALEFLGTPIGYRYFFCKTLLYSSDIKVTSLNRLDEYADLDLSAYDCLIYIRNTDCTEDWRNYDFFSAFDGKVIEYSCDY